MAIYTVHIPVDGADPASAADRAVFLREGFSWAAFVFGPLWLIARRLWRPLAIWCLAAVLVGLAISHGLLKDSAGAWLYLIGAVFLGLEARGFRAAAMERRGLRFADVVTGAGLVAAETGFFSRPPDATPAAAPSPASARVNRPAVDAHVIGLFPEAGG